MGTTSRVHYNAPARAWTEALPLGNGRMGVMAFFDPASERLALNEDTLWSGYPREHRAKAPIEALKTAREALEQNDYARAQQVIEQDFTSDYSHSYLPLGDITIDYALKGEAGDYTRELDMSKGVARCAYSVNSHAHTRECFVSAPDQMIVYRAYTDDEHGLDALINLKCPMMHTLTIDDTRVILEGECPGQARPSYTNDPNAIKYFTQPEKRGIRFRAIMSVTHTGGSARYDNRALVIAGARSFEIRLCARSSFAGADKHPYLQGAEYVQKVSNEIDACAQLSYETLKQRHIQDFSALYERVSFSLEKPAEADELPTDERLKRYQEGGHDPRLYELIFNFGRYLMISASRPGTRAMNLQGIWNESMQPPWSSNYTININTEMNYWPAESCALSECHAPLFDLIMAVNQTGRITARDFYGARGAVSHHNTDIWGMSNPVGEGKKGCAVYAYWQMSFGWLCRHLFDHYLYTLDEQFLRERALPALRDAARFYLDTMTRVGARLAISPATSPENSFFVNGAPQSVARTSAMSQAIVLEVFKHTLKAESLLGDVSPLSDEILDACARLHGLMPGSKGQLLEWDMEYEECEPHHRHTSHLYALHPMHHITPQRMPESAKACETSLNLRGDDGTGWALGWKINMWARLGDGDHALKLLRNQLRYVPSVPNETVNYAGGGGTYLNLFDAHPPFQIDGNFAATAGIAEMLLRSEPDEMHILPALPSEWKTGSIKGLRAMNAMRVDIAFEHGALKRAHIVCEKKPLTSVSVIYGSKTLLVIENSGEYDLKGDE